MSEISKLITKYIEEFVSTSDKDNKDDIIKDFKSKENKKKLDEFIASNNIKKKKNKSEKDENKPKKALTPYFLYVKENRSLVKDDSGLTDNLEVTRELSKRWNIIKTEESSEFKKYCEMSDEQKKEYSLKIQEYNQSHGIVDKPKTAFQHFKEENVESVKSEFPDISKKEIHRKLQLKWKELQSEKCDTVKKYMNMASNEKENCESDKTVNVEIAVEKHQEENKDTVDNDDVVVEDELPIIAVVKKKKKESSSKKKKETLA
jgi:hypothetical protein